MCCSLPKLVQVCLCVAVLRSMLHYTAACCSVLQLDAVCSIVLQCVVVCCSVLQCVAVWTLMKTICTSVALAICCVNDVGSVLHYVAACCSVLQCAAVWNIVHLDKVKDYLHNWRTCNQLYRWWRECVARCCRVLQRAQCVAVCCSVLQCIAMCYSVHLDEWKTIRTTVVDVAAVMTWMCFSALQSAVMCCNLLHSVAVCCSVPFDALKTIRTTVALVAYCISSDKSVVQTVAVCCSVLQCVAVCCSVLQCVAVCCSVLQCVEECTLMSWRLSAQPSHLPSFVSVMTGPNKKMSWDAPRYKQQKNTLRITLKKWMENKVAMPLHI